MLKFHIHPGLFCYSIRQFNLGTHWAQKCRNYSPAEMQIVQLNYRNVLHIFAFVLPPHIFFLFHAKLNFVLFNLHG